MHPIEAQSKIAEFMHELIHPQNYIRVKIWAKIFFHTIFWYLKRNIYEHGWGFHKIYLGTKSIVNIFICV